jgi:hypothetical protein
MEGDPLAVGLQLAFLAILYLFLFAIARSALKDLRGGKATPGPAPDGTGLHAAGPARVAATDAWLVVLGGPGLEPGDRIDLFGGLTIGRNPDVDLRIDDRFASGLHCRIYTRGNAYLLEDLDSTNGTYVNGARVTGEVELRDLDEVTIGEVALRFELALPEAGGSR